MTRSDDSCTLPAAGAALRTGPPTLLGPAACEAILARAEIVREEATMLAGPIRVLAVDGGIQVLEEAPDGRRLLRDYPDRAAADAFVDRRLETYDRMWDGCGCKIDYDEP